MGPKGLEHIRKWEPQKEVGSPDPSLSTLPPCTLPWSQRERTIYLTLGHGCSDPPWVIPWLWPSLQNGLITESSKGWYPGRPGPQGSLAWPSRFPYWVLRMWGDGEGRGRTQSIRRLPWGLLSRDSSIRETETTTIVPHVPCLPMALDNTDITELFCCIIGANKPSFPGS